MKPSETQQLLIDFLTISKASEPTKAIVFIQMESEELQLRMCEFLSKNKQATDQEIVTAANRIAAE